MLLKLSILIGWTAIMIVQNHSSLRLSVVTLTFSLDMQVTGTRASMNTIDRTLS